MDRAGILLSSKDETNKENKDTSFPLKISFEKFARSEVILIYYFVNGILIILIRFVYLSYCF